MEKIYQNAKAMPTMDCLMEAGELTVVAASGRWMVQSLFRAGLGASLYDLYSDRDVPGACEKFQLKSLSCAANQLSHSTTLVFGGGFENHFRAFVPLLRSHLALNFTEEQVALVRSVTGMKSIANAAGVSTPATTFTGEGIPWTQDGSRLLIKPLNGTAGAGIRFLTAGDSPQEHEIIQEFIEGRAMSASYLATEGEGSQLLGVCRQMTGVREFGATSAFQFCGAMGPVDLGEEALNAVRKMGEQVHRHTGCRGLFGIDFVLDEAGRIFLLEVNPRPTASMEVVEWALGTSLMGLHIRAFAQKDVACGSLSPKAGRLFGKAIRYHSGTRTRVVTRRQSARWMRGARQRRLADIPVSGARIAAGQPVFTVFATGNREPEVLAQLCRRMAALPLWRR